MNGRALNFAGLALVGIVGIAFLVLTPRFAELDTVLELTVYIIMAILALSLALIWGYGGSLSFGQVLSRFMPHDVLFGEDACRTRKDHAPENLAALTERDTTGTIAVAANAINPPLAVISLPALAPTPVPAPADARTLRERGIYAYRGGDLSGALAHFNLAIAQDPEQARHWYQKAAEFGSEEARNRLAQMTN